MVSSVLSPEKIVGRQNTNKAAAQNFISGGSVVGAANKIVGFQRAGVQPAPSATGSIVSTISTNINNNVTNTINKTLQGFSADYQRRVKEFDINKITTNVTNTVNKTLQGFSADYQRRLKQVDDAKPIGILGKFLNVYKTSLGFINFFGNKKNIDKVRDSLEALKKSFTESFEVAKLIRQVIIKIVKQLSNLPVASPSGGGGLNLDVDIPGGGLKKSAPRGLGRMMGGGKGKMLALGAGALGLGAAGAGAVNALSDSPQVQAVGTSPEIPGDIADRFSSIVDRFANAISKLFETNKQKSKQQQQQQSSGGKGEKKPPGKTKPPEPTGPAVSSAPGDEKLAAFVATMEAGSPENAADAMQVMLNRSASGKYGKGLSGVLSGYDQFSPISAAIFGKSEDEHAQAKYGPIAAKLPGNTPQEKFKYLQQVASEPDGLNKLQQLFGGGNSGVAATILNDSKYLESSRQNVKGALNFYGGKKKNASDIQVRSGGNNFYNFTGPIGTLGKQPTGTTVASQVAPAPTQSAAQQQIAQKPGAQVAATPQAQAAQVEAAKTAQTQVAQRAAAVSQIAQSQPQVNYLPIDMSGGGQQQSGGGGSSGGGGGGGSQGSGPSVPFLPAGNPNNFLVLYSRMVYNIVDG
jgi:hypothetical protein